MAGSLGGFLLLKLQTLNMPRAVPQTQHYLTTVRTPYFHTKLSQKTNHSPHNPVMEDSPCKKKITTQKCKYDHVLHKISY